jgi:hypothetical protein
MLHLLYIDPGSGSYFIQAVIAALFGAWFWIKSYWTRIKQFFMKKTSGEEEKKEENS